MKTDKYSPSRAALFVVAQEPQKKPPVAEDAKAKFETTFRKMSAEKTAIMRDARQLLAERYDLTDRPAAGVTMTRGKPVQDGVRVNLPAGVTWQQLAAMSPAEIRSRGVWPLGFMPLPHPNHPEGGMLFRFDLDFDIPDPFLPEFPPPIFLTTRPDLGDVSQGKLITSENFNEILSGILNPKQELFDFPPAPKLGVDGKLDAAKATPAEMRGQQLFFGKAQCSTCHVPPYYTDGNMHDLQSGRFFEPKMIRHHMAVMDGKIKTFPLRGIKDPPPYLHDGRLMTLDDTVEFFNLILGIKLTDQEKKDLVTFMRAL